MDGEDQRLRRALAAFGGNVWALTDAALAAAAARDRPEELRARRDGIVERLYAAAGCSNCDGRPPRAALAAAGLQEDEEAAAAVAAALSPEPEADAYADREKWKEIVDDWVRLHNTGGDGGNSLINGIFLDTSLQISEFKYSPSPQRHNAPSSERPNGFGPAMDVKRRASPAPTYQNSRQINNTHNHSTTSSVPAKMARDHKDNLLDLDKLDSARRRLQENYQEAQMVKN
ncbi:hypothetical protein PR202_ga24684 [Eleusine coracana subsp. coracana]|uniref:Uncharacterized protein n=1 Tax=Eleusine coracana subsp. coracana TaxID=191504 RepID=A0AAV5DA72_ELECO|nr:hypothetical protein PR202_ga24684 [Eleusine coracana subsp. coracana]